MKSTTISFKNIRKGSITALCLLLIAGCLETNEESIAPKENSGISSDDNQSSASARMAQRNFTAHLSGNNEVPPAETGGVGQAIFKLSDDGTALHFKLVVANIENVTQSHIHCGSPGVNGPVVAFLFGFAPGGVNVNGVLAEGIITDANVIPRPASAACSGGIANLDDLIQKLRNGEAYVNVHTLAYPGGEIRGAIQ